MEIQEYRYRNCGRILHNMNRGTTWRKALLWFGAWSTEVSCDSPLQVSKSQLPVFFRAKNDSIRLDAHAFLRSHYACRNSTSHHYSPPTFAEWTTTLIMLTSFSHLPLLTETQIVSSSTTKQFKFSNYTLHSSFFPKASVNAFVHRLAPPAGY